MVQKNILIVILFVIIGFSFNSKENVYARFPIMTSIYSSEWNASLLNRELKISVQVGDNIISDPCGKIVKLKSNRPEYDVISEVNNKVECNYGYTYFKIKSSQAGISKITAEIDGIVIASKDFSFFVKREDNVLVSPIGHPHVFLIKDIYKYRIKNPSVLYAHGYKWSDVINIDPVEEHMYTIGNIKIESLAKIDDQIYYVYNDLKLPVSMEMIKDDRIGLLDVHIISDANLVWELRRMKLLLNKENNRVYYITEKGKKRHIINEAVFDSYNNKWNDVVEVSNGFLNNFSDVELIRSVDGYKVYKIENGEKRWIKTVGAFKSMGFKWSDIALVNNLEISEYLEGEDIN